MLSDWHLKVSHCPKNNLNLCIKTYSLSRLEQMQRFWFWFQSWQSRFFVWRFRLILRQRTRSYDLWLELFEWYLLEKMLNYLSLLQLPARTEGQCTGLHNTHLFCYWHCYLYRYDRKRRLYHSFLQQLLFYYFYATVGIRAYVLSSHCNCLYGDCWNTGNGDIFSHLYSLRQLRVL